MMIHLLLRWIMPVSLFHGDNIKVLKTLSDNSIDACVTDPPYGISFMSHKNKWDYDVPSVDLWREVLRVLKPGGHVLSFSSTRTYHRMVVNLEDAGFEVRDQLGWIFGSGMPKSLNISKAIDKAAGAKREVVGSKLGRPGYSAKANDTTDHERVVYGRYTDAEAECAITAPATDAARQWEGWGTTLKPAWEPCVLARKPLIGTVVENILTHGTGGLNIDSCRVPSEGGRYREGEASQDRRYTEKGSTNFAAKPGPRGGDPEGRFPSNILHDGSEQVEAAFAAFGEKTSGKPGTRRKPHETHSMSGRLNQTGEQEVGYADSGSVSRFFYAAKASSKDRAGSKHPTVKPVSLMSYLVKLVTPPKGVVLDPFAGSGTTGQAAIDNGFDAILVERESEYVEDIRNRLLMYIDRDEAVE